MKYEMVPIVLARELEEAIAVQYDIAVTLKELFFKDEAPLNSIGGYLLTFSENNILVEKFLSKTNTGNEDYRSQRLCVLNYLYDTIYKETGCDFCYIQGILH